MTAVVTTLTPYRRDTPTLVRVDENELVVDLVAGRVRVGGRTIAITPAEGRVLAALAAAGECPRHYAELGHLFGATRRAVDDEMRVRALISRLRAKLEDDPRRPRRLVTVGGGYRLRGARIVDQPLTGGGPAPRPRVVVLPPAEGAGGLIAFAGRVTRASPTEAAVLRALAARAPRYCTAEELALACRADGLETQAASVKSAILRLRRAIETGSTHDRLLTARRGYGYRLEPGVDVVLPP
jgi:DNA-binding response OmpR family regulator